MPWRDLDFHKMSELRQSVDGRQSHYPSGGSSGGWETPTVQTKLKDALAAVVAGRIDPEQVLAQLPAHLLEILDTASNAIHGKPVDDLATNEKRAILGLLARAVRDAPAGGARGSPTASASATRTSPASTSFSAAAKPAAQEASKGQNSHRPAHSPAGGSRIGVPRPVWLRGAAALVAVAALAVGAYMIWRWLLR
jgi:hypothetical protein